MADDLRARRPRIHVRGRPSFRHKRPRPPPLQPLAARITLGRRLRRQALSRSVNTGYVLVTGSSSGIGEACARHLAAQGFNVFAGVRKQEDGERVAGDRIEPLIIDVTDDASVADAAESIRSAVGNSGLAGLVNNAGIGIAGPLEFVDISRFQQQLEVNVTGVLRTTKAMLPWIRLARGRIVNISSIGGRVAVPIVG